MINPFINRIMQSYFIVYCGIAVVQFLLFAMMRDIGVLSFIMAGIWIGLLMLIAHRIPHKRAVIAFSLAGLFIKWIWIIFVPTPAISDYKLMYNTARELLEGGREYLNNIYYQRFPYQLGFTAYQALVLSILDSVTGLKMVNAVWCAIASLAVYGIALEAFDRNVARLALLLHITLLPILLLSSVLTNQHIAATWFYIGIYVWMKGGRTTWWAPGVAGAALAIGSIMRPIGIIVIAAIVVNEVISAIQQKSKNQWKQSLLKAGTAVAAYQLLLALISFLFSQSGISPEGLVNKDPLWKLVTGLNSAANGSYSTADEIRLNYGYMQIDKRTELEKELIKERLTSPKNMFKLPFIKIGKLWADYQPTWFTFPRMEGTNFNYLGWSISFDEAITRYWSIERAVMYILSILAFWRILKILRFEFHSVNKRFLVLILGAHTFVHLIVEVQSRYLYFLFAFIVIFSAVELFRIKEWMSTIKNKYRVV